MNIQIRPSKIASLLACEKAGMRSLGFVELKVRERVEHVATWIGKAVHARLAGAPEPEPPKLLVYDDVTPSRRRAEVQIFEMHAALATEVESLGWTTLAHEVQVGPVRWDHWPQNVHLEGTSDLLAVDSDFRGVLLDVKTSKEVVKAWLQLGCYVLAYEHNQVNIEGAPRFIDRVAVAHCPRPQSILSNPTATISIQAASFVLGESWNALNRIIVNMQNPDAAPAAPGPHCRYCDHPECPVRAHGYQL